jgi:hypothetical protein
VSLCVQRFDSILMVYESRLTVCVSAVRYYYPSKFLGWDIVTIFLYLLIDQTRLMLGEFCNFPRYDLKYLHAQ